MSIKKKETKPKATPPIKNNIRVLKMTDDPVVILLRPRAKAAQMATSSRTWNTKIPFRIEIHDTHIIVDTMEQGSRKWDPWLAKQHRRTFWFTDIIAMNDTIKRIKEGSL